MRSLMEFVNIHQAKTHLSTYLAKIAETHETIVICRNGKPIAELAPYQTKQKIKFGTLKGKIKIADDFDELPDSFMEHFK